MSSQPVGTGRRIRSPLSVVLRQTWVLLLTTSVAFAQTLSLKTEAVVDQPFVYLQDIIEHPVPHELAHIRVSRAPRVAQIQVIDAAYVARLISEQTTDVKLDAASSVKVSRRSQTISSTEIISALSTTLSERWHTTPSTLIIHSKFGQREFHIPFGDVDVRIASFSPQLPSSDVRAWVEIRVNDQHYQTHTLSFNVEWPTPALILNKPVSLGSVVEPDDVTPITLDKLSTNCELAETVLAGQIALHDLTSHSALCRRSIGGPFAVARGEEIDLMIDVGAVTLTLPVIAQSFAQIGDIITVIRPYQPDTELLVEVIQSGALLVKKDTL